MAMRSGVCLAKARRRLARPRHGDDTHSKGKAPQREAPKGKEKHLVAWNSKGKEMLINAKALI
jgi:hypothetical protein